MTSPRLSTDGGIDAAAWVFRHRGREMLTVVAKAAFRFAARVAAPHVGPAAIVRVDRTFGDNPSRSVEAASDLAPFKARCDVTLVGHAHQPIARMILGSPGRVRIDKALRVEGGGRVPLVYESAAGGPGTANPVGSESPRVVDIGGPGRAGGFGPISAFWPARKRLLQGMDRRAIEGGDLPEAISWDYFQSAPPELQIEYPRGGEWLVLEGLTAAEPRIETVLPEVRPVASLALAAAGPRRAFDLVCDTIHITPDAGSLSLAWRGCLDVTALDLSSATVAVALPSGSSVLDLDALHARAAASGPAPTSVERPAPPASSVGEGTVAMGEAAPRAAVLPFTSNASAKEAVGESTHVMSSREHEAHGVHAPAPFAIAPPRLGGPSAPPKQGVPWSSEPLAPAPAAAVGEATQAAPAPRPLAPSSASGPTPPPGPAPSAPAPSAAGPPAPVPSAPADPLAARLRGAGATAEEIAVLLAAISTDPKR